MRRIFIELVLLTWMAIGAAPLSRAETIDVQIGSDSARAAVVLLDELNKKGAEQDLSFRLNKGEFTIKFIITWRRGGPGYKSPWARVDVYNADGMPLFSVDREGRAFTRRGAVGRCAKEIVKLLPSHLPKQTLSRRNARPLAATLRGCERIRDCHRRHLVSRLLPLAL